MIDNPQNYAIVPIVATPKMWSEIFRIIKEENKTCDIAYEAAISAAPPHNLVAVDKGELERWQKVKDFITKEISDHEYYSVSTRESTGECHAYKKIKELLK